LWVPASLKSDSKDETEMGFELDGFGDVRLDADYLDWLVEARAAEIGRHFARLWDYYANPTVDVAGSGAVSRKVHESGRPYVQAQEYGLPSRITGLMHSPATGAFDSRIARDIQRKEVVIENDIAWRVNAAADFLFGKPIRIVSKAPDSRRRRPPRSRPITLWPRHSDSSPSRTKSGRRHMTPGPLYAKLDPGHLKLRLPHSKLDLGHFKLGLPHSKLDLPHIKSTPRQIKRPPAFRKSLSRKLLA